MIQTDRKKIIKTKTKEMIKAKRKKLTETITNPGNILDRGYV